MNRPSRGNQLVKTATIKPTNQATVIGIVSTWPGKARPVQTLRLKTTSASRCTKENVMETIESNGYVYETGMYTIRVYRKLENGDGLMFVADFEVRSAWPQLRDEAMEAIAANLRR
jgi:hypothetical protein